ncbi:MAG: signal peptidase II, partial [Bacillota bacterium]
HQTTFFIAVSVLVVAGVTGYYLYKKPLPPAQQVALALICGGALGNLWDRSLYGEVIDFLHLSFWPVFNLADVAIVGGTCLLVLLLWRAGEQEGR